MDKTTTIVLIDGQNLYYTLRRANLKETDIAWDKFFHSLLEGKEDRLLRVYWFRPAKVKEIRLLKFKVAKSLFHNKYKNREEEFIQRFKNGSLPQNVFDEINKIYRRNLAWIKQERQSFSIVDNKYKRFENKYSEIEIVRTGVLKIDPYSRKRLGEKGVDVAVGVKMVELALTNKCDKIILMSGDLDFWYAVKLVKANRKMLHVVQIESNKTRGSMAIDLAALADKVIKVDSRDLNSKFSLVKREEAGMKPELEQFKDLIKEYVIEDKLSEAIKKLKVYFKSNKPELDNLTVHLLASLNSTNNSVIKGTMTNLQANVEFSKIREGILNLLDQF